MPESAKTRSAAWVYAALSVLLLVPCFWQPRLQAGDLSSHIYNAWLAQLIESGRTQGLVLAHQTTNVLFDLMLSGLFRALGAEAAQRIAVSAAVLLFVWGAFAFVSKVAGARPWHMLISIAMLAYGWVFHMGFFDFYLSLGLCFWALAIAWDATPWRIAISVAILAIAYLAHGLPVLWTLSLLAYVLLSRSLPARWRALLTPASLLAMMLVHWIISRTMLTRWSPQQIANTTGLDQVWVFGLKYYPVMAGLLFLWGVLFLELLRGSGARKVTTSVPFQLCLISAMGVFIMPTAVLIPGFQHSLVYIAERMSLGVGVCMCALLGCVQPRPFVRYAMGAVAVLFFALLFRDERALNSFEDRIQDAVAQLEPGQRVLNGVDDPSLHTFAVTHMIDRECLGHCFSYANYEASTGQFRIRAMAANAYVAYRYGDSLDMQQGRYVVKPRDLPLYQVDLDNGRFIIRLLEAGQPCGIKFWNTLASPPPAGRAGGKFSGPAS